MYSRYALSVRRQWDDLANSTESDFINYYKKLVQPSYFDDTSALDKPGDYRQAEYFCCDGLLLLLLNQDVARAGEILCRAAEIAARMRSGDPKGIVAGDPTTPSAVAFISIKRMEPTYISASRGQRSMAVYRIGTC
jgi:hypothetical protein